MEEPEFSIEFSDVHRAASVRDERELPDGNRLSQRARQELQEVRQCLLARQFVCGVSRGRY